jgi:hypothetical protein
MKALAILIFSLFLLGSLKAQTVSKQKEFQAKILQMRVGELLQSRKNGLDQCVLKNKKYSPTSHQKFVKNFQEIKSGRFISETEKVSRSLELMASTENHPDCSKEIIFEEKKLHDLQRKKFQEPIEIVKRLCHVLIMDSKENCLYNMNELVKELDPFCVTQNSENIFGKKDPNPCMAGDRLLGSVLRKSNDPGQRIISQFLGSLQNHISAQAQGSTVDLWNIFLVQKNNRDSLRERKEFLSLLAFFYYAMGSAGGYIDGIGDFYWESSLKEVSFPEDAFAEFYSMRQKVDWYGHLKKQASKKKIKFVFKHIELEGMNRHDFMAMFLSCHLKAYGKVASKTIPLFLGLSYESLDFVSHIKEKVSLEKSLENFKQDNSRYSAGTSIGNKFCGMKSDF